MQRIRAAVVGDVDDLVKLAQQLNKAKYSRKNVLLLLQSSNTHCFILEDEKVVIGTITLSSLVSLERGPYGIISGFVVNSGHRGAGNGELLFDSVVKVAKGLGLRFVQLESKRNRTKARSLYKKKGFHETKGIQMEKYLN